MSDKEDDTSRALVETSTAGEVGEGPPTKKIKKIIRRKRRPARVQIDPSELPSGPPPQTGTIFNIWYNKWSGGDREDKYLSKTKARGRCNIKEDSGYTKADGVSGSYFCLFFARGTCPRGQDCEYLHRLPTVMDIFNPTVDCFGRDKFSDYRDDMGGVGSFRRQNRTIYVGRITVSDDVEEVVRRHFAEWGEIERLRVLEGRGVAFVTYKNEANAQFAREAMAHQSLDHDEVLNVRWATPDPNPAAIRREARRVEEQAAEAIRRALPPEFVAEIEAKARGEISGRNKRQRIEGGSAGGNVGAGYDYGLEGYEVPDEVHFAVGPNAVNPIGRRGFEEEDEVPYEERMMMLEDSGARDGTTEQQPPPAAGGIFSSSTLAAISSAAAMNGSGSGSTQEAQKTKPQQTTRSGPLVAYGSDSEDDE